MGIEEDSGMVEVNLNKEDEVNLNKEDGIDEVLGIEFLSTLAGCVSVYAVQSRLSAGNREKPSRASLTV